MIPEQVCNLGTLTKTAVDKVNQYKQDSSFCCSHSLFQANLRHVLCDDYEKLFDFSLQCLPVAGERDFSLEDGKRIFVSEATGKENKYQC